MNNYNELLINLPKIHTTELGYKRIKNNLNIGDSDVVNYCKNLINDCNCEIVRIGKNWYCKLNNICITVNAYSFTIFIFTRSKIKMLLCAFEKNLIGKYLTQLLKMHVRR